jgi:hypothetical protein
MSVYLKAAEASQVELTEAIPGRVEKVGWRKLSFFRSRQPTAFQRCLALHLHGAERSSALD